MSKFPYQIGILGDFTSYADVIEATIQRRFSDLGFGASDFHIFRGADIECRERKAPFAAVFFGYDGADSALHPELKDALADSSVVLPIVDSLASFSRKVPAELKHINGMERNLSDPDFESAVSVVLENFRLLRRDRRLFISYKRTDSGSVALQLHDALERHWPAPGFVDTHLS